MSFIEELKNLTNRTNTYPEQFFSAKARFDMELTMKSDLRISIAPILPGVSNRPVAGEKRYDDDNKAVITLNKDDLTHLCYHFEIIKNGSYVNPNSSDPKYSNLFTISHPAPYGSNKEPSFINFSKGNNSSVIVAIKGQDGKRGSFMLQNSFNEQKNQYNYSLSTFENLIHTLSRSGVYDSLQRKSFIKILNHTIFNMGNQQSQNNRTNNYQNRNNNQNYNQNYNNNNSYESHPQQIDWSPPPQQQRPPQQPMYNNTPVQPQIMPDKGTGVNPVHNFPNTVNNNAPQNIQQISSDDDLDNMFNEIADFE